MSANLPYLKECEGGLIPMNTELRGMGGGGGAPNGNRNFLHQVLADSVDVVLQLR